MPAGLMQCPPKSKNNFHQLAQSGRQSQKTYRSTTYVFAFIHIAYKTNHFPTRSAQQWKTLHPWRFPRLDKALHKLAWPRSLLGAGGWTGTSNPLALLWDELLLRAAPLSFVASPNAYHIQQASAHILSDAMSSWVNF